MMLAILYFAALLIGSTIAMPLGGLFNAVVGCSFALPIFGRAFAFLNRFIHVTLLAKLASWVISASGLAVSYLLIERMFGPPRNVWQWSAVTAAAAVVVLNLSSRIVTFETFHVTTLDEVREYLPSFIAVHLSEFEDDELAVLLQQNFTDVNFTAVLQLLVAFGILFFGLANLRVLMTAAKASVPSILECVAVAFSFGKLYDGQTVMFTGSLWLTLRFIAGIVLLVWSMRFIAFANELLRQRAAEPVSSFEKYREQIEKIVNDTVAKENGARDLLRRLVRSRNLRRRQI